MRSVRPVENRASRWLATSRSAASGTWAYSSMLSRVPRAMLDDPRVFA